MTHDGTVNVRDHGAAGDGKTDDTLAIRRAMAALPERGGVLYFSPGHYLTDTIYPPNFTTLMGSSGWGYQEPGGTILSPVKPLQPRLIDLNGRIATRLIGLTLHGRDFGDDMTGVFLARGVGHEQNLIIDGCRIEHFSGSGVAMNESHVWHIRHSTIFANGKDGIDASNSFDGWIIDCEIVTNGRHGLVLNNSTAVTGCRIEHNGDTGLSFNRHYAQHVQVTGNTFCSNRGPAVEILPGNVRALTFTGNSFRNSGLHMQDTPDRYCHVRFHGVQGLTFTGNALHVLWNDKPGTAMILQDLVDSVVMGNTLFKGATHTLIDDRGGHTNSVIRDNPGSLKLPDDLES